MYVCIYICGHPLHDLPRSILYGNHHMFLHIKHNQKFNNLQKGRSWGSGFCTWMFHYIWVVIIISNALLFNGNDWFKTFVWPLHPLVTPIICCNHNCIYTCIIKTIFWDSLGGAWAWNLKLEQLGPHREKQTKPGKTKKLKQNQKKQTKDFWENAENQTKNVFDRFQCRKPNQKCWKKQKSFLFFEILIHHIHSKKMFFLVFHFRHTKKTRENQKKHLLSQNQTFSQKFWFFCFLVLLEFFFSIDSQDCQLCPYACLPCRSWKIKLWSKFLTQELAHYARLSLA